MRHSFWTGLSFGLTSATITTLGLMVGLHSGTQSRLAVIGGILIIAIADAFSDALGIHVSQEAKGYGLKDIWESTLATFMAKFVFAMTFVIPVLLLPFELAMIVSVVWGMILLGVFSFIIAKQQNVSPRSVVLEHLVIALLVVIITHFLGDGIRRLFS